jgi:uncharacterized repeat protein (TIGR03847 family)
MEKRYDFEDVGLLSAFAVGKPGKRTFFLAIGQKQEWVRAWLEKDQLEALATAVEQLLFTVAEQQPGLVRGLSRPPPADEAPSGLPAAELQVEEMTLGFDEGKASIKLMARPMGPQEDVHAELTCRVTLSQMKGLGQRAEAVCAAGRPRCQLCGLPLDSSGHVCPRYN